jgi:hypothetical protein
MLVGEQQPFRREISADREHALVVRLVRVGKSEWRTRQEELRFLARAHRASLTPLAFAVNAAGAPGPSSACAAGSSAARTAGIPC